MGIEEPIEGEELAEEELDPENESDIENISE